MGTLRSRKYLRCFYCGQRSNIRFESQKSFDCSNCDATNWLDKNGEITDPPTEAESFERNHLQYAIPRSRSSAVRSPSPSLLDPAAESKPSDSVFCTTCLRNQHILSSSLAQFEWPDEYTSAEYAARERKYYALRKDLEKRYPQVCEECLPKVERKLHQANYTAKTDHLRRVVDRTRSQLTEVKKRGLLDAIDALGKSSWYAGFVIQAVWHLAVLSLLLTDTYAATRDGHWIPVALGAFHRMTTSMLPYTDRLMQWAINIGMCSFPWNPRFKQTIRGFTAHILGFRQWYTYQLLILLVRFVALSIAQYSKSRSLPASTQLGAQLVMLLFMIYVFRTARKSIRTDTTPLFRQPAKVTAGLRPEADDVSATKDPNDLGNILDEILHSPTKQQDEAVQTSPQHSASLASALGRQRLGTGAGMMSGIPPSYVTDRALPLPELDASKREEPLIPHYDEEMDWSPSASQHRAFSSYNPYKVKNTNPRFSDTPTEPKSGPIWYKVPPAPTTPAQRLRNPPMRPIIRESPKEKQETFFQSTRRQPLDLGNKTGPKSADLPLAQPTFFAPLPRDDPRDGLSSMFANSFSISPSPEEQAERHARNHGRAKSQTHGSDSLPNRTMTRIAELVALLAALCGWIFALDSREHYGRSMALSSICVCLIVSIRLAADVQADHQVRGGTRSSFFASSFANLALVQVIVVIVLMCSIWSGSTPWVSTGVYGNVLFGSIIIHHMWHIFA